MREDAAGTRDRSSDDLPRSSGCTNAPAGGGAGAAAATALNNTERSAMANAGAEVEAAADAEVLTTAGASGRAVSNAAVEVPTSRKRKKQPTRAGGGERKKQPTSASGGVWFHKKMRKFCFWSRAAGRGRRMKTGFDSAEAAAGALIAYEQLVAQSNPRTTPQRTPRRDLRNSPCMTMRKGARQTGRTGSVRQMSGNGGKEPLPGASSNGPPHAIETPRKHRQGR